MIAYRRETTWQRWDEMWAKQQARDKVAQKKENKIAVAADVTRQEQEALAALENTLAHTLDIDDTIDWEQLKNKGKYPIPKPEMPIPPSSPEPPADPEPPVVPDPPTPEREPKRDDASFEAQLGFLDKLITSRRLEKERDAEERFKRVHSVWEQKKEAALARWSEEKEAALARWREEKKVALSIYQRKKEEHQQKLQELEAEHKAAVEAWEEERAEYLRERYETNAAIDGKKAQYIAGDPDAIFDYCDMVLSNSEYPGYFPQSYELNYNPSNKTLIVDYQLPSKESIPKVKEVKYVQSRDEFDEKHISNTQLNKLYDSLLYQITLRTVHELYEADKAEALDAIVFNGYVQSIDPATGQESTACVLSFQASKDEFMVINLAHVDPKACFKKLKGVGSSKLHSMTPIAPIQMISREDSRFTEAYAVVDSVQEGDNLAAMDWEDFEHLIRELFEKEFSEGGAEVKVTQASRDGGVDAVVFDPDPIRGGKIVIQAKRYTNTVGVAAVRDLYGTVMNEGAIKGILVTTSDYGPDAYGFAKDKPLTLLNGGNLLHLLEKHGHKARIDLKEAKKLAAEQANKP